MAAPRTKEQVKRKVQDRMKAEAAFEKCRAGGVCFLPDFLDRGRERGVY